MSVVAIEIRSRVPFVDGREFGTTGPYERIDGILRFAVDPANPANRRIVDLDRAERGAGGRVHFAADFSMLQPADSARANGRLLFHVVNRGRYGVVPFSVAPPPPAIDGRIDPGDGFLLRRGWTVFSGGWQWDVIRRPGYLGLDAPSALVADGRPIQGNVLVEFQPSEPYRSQILAHWPLHPPPGNPDFRHQSYPAADPDDPVAVLTVRDWADGPRTIVPRGRWRFARDEAGRPIPDDSSIWLDDGFAPGKLYEVVYRTRGCPVVGTGLLAVRDAVSFLRYASLADGNPAADRISHAIGFGSSQCGRFLREFVYQGLNLDEDGRPVFDGLFAHVAGARRGEFNHRYAQPSAQHARGFGHLPPFADDEQTDPLSGETAGLLRRQRALGSVPRIVTVNTSSEYWRSDCSLIHTDPAGQHDLEPPSEVRLYLFAGAQHGPGAVPLTRQTPSGARTANPLNVVNFTPLMRAALINLESWIVGDREPPPSRFPRLADGTAVPRPAVLRAFAEIPGASLLVDDRLPRLRRVDLGPEADGGIGRFPPRLGEPYPSYVSAVDADRNEVAGVRLPDLTVPLASHTGWNPRDPSTGGAGQNVDMQGSTLPFPRTREERERTGDPRRSIKERYRDRVDYLARVRTEAERLVEERHLLAEDVALVVDLAAARYDTFVGAGAPVASSG